MSHLHDHLGPLAPQEVATASLAPRLLGRALACVLYGLTTSMLIGYLRSPSWKTDSAVLRTIVVAVGILNTVHTVADIILIIVPSISQNRSVIGILQPTVVDSLSLLPHVAIAALTQGYLARRACLLVQTTRLRVALAVFFAIGISGVCAGLVTNFVRVIQIVHGSLPQSSRFAIRQARVLYLVSSALVDCTVTLVLGVVLSTQIMGFNERSDNVIRRIINLSLRTAAVTSIDAVAGAVLSLAFGSHSVYTNAAYPFISMLPPLYCFTLLTTVAGRADLARDLSSGVRQRGTITFPPSGEDGAQTRSTRLPLTSRWTRESGDLGAPDEVEVELGKVEKGAVEMLDERTPGTSDAAHGVTISVSVERTEQCDH